jgi:hypothetical protein
MPTASENARSAECNSAIQQNAIQRYISIRNPQSAIRNLVHSTSSPASVSLIMGNFSGVSAGG